MNIVRKIKIDKMIPVLTDKEKELIKFIELSFSNLDSYTHKEWKDSIFYFQNNKYIFEHSAKGKMALIRYEGFVSILESQFDIHDVEIITSLILNYLQHTLKVGKDKLNLVMYENSTENIRYVERVESMQYNTQFMNKIEIKRGIN